VRAAAEAVIATVDHSVLRGLEPHNRDPSGARNLKASLLAPTGGGWLHIYRMAGGFAAEGTLRFGWNGEESTVSAGWGNLTGGLKSSNVSPE
jgi:hypothetical protein